MHAIRFVTIALMFGSVACSGAAPAAAPPQAHEAENAPTAEPGWNLGGYSRADYAVTKDTDGLRLAPIAAEGDRRYVTWMRSVDATPYVGKRVQITMSVRTSGTTRRADFWARAQGKDSPGDGGGLGGDRQALAADTGWTSYALVFDVAKDATALQYGAGIGGPGTLWMRDAKVEIVGEGVALTHSRDEWPGEKTIAPWTMTGIGAPDYQIAADGDSVRIESTQDSQRFVALLREAPAKDFIGKSVHATFDARADGIADLECVLKVQKTRRFAYAGFLAADAKPVHGDAASFVPCDLVAQVPAGAETILYGVTYRGAGRAWVKGGAIEAR